MTIWAIIPVKNLQATKSRLTAVLSTHERANLTQQLLQRLLHLLQEQGLVSQVVVVSRDQTVATLAQPLGAMTVAEAPDALMSGAIHTGVRLAAKAGARQALIMPSDLPFLLADDLAVVCQTAVTNPNTLIICPDRHEQGTNALLLPPQLQFQFQFGPNSLQKHIQEARRLDHEPQIMRTPGWQFDLDTPEDWDIYASSEIHNL